MKREGTIGLGAVLAIAAAVGISLQSGSKQEVNSRGEQAGLARRTEPAEKKPGPHEKRSGCKALEGELEEFFEIKMPSVPDSCYEPGDAPKAAYPPGTGNSDTNLKFVIAILPDPVHTHLSALFDQIITAVQEGAQDEHFDFDSSWLPWETDGQPYALLTDQKTASTEQQWKETQPGVILFRRKLPDSPYKTPKDPKPAEEPEGYAQTRPAGHTSSKTQKSLERYRDGLVVFVVGDEATHGIHRQQFRNALAWINTLQASGRRGRVGILGPTFSGSFPSLAQVLSEENSAKLFATNVQADERLAIYSGSVSGAEAAQSFQDQFASQISFHSFVESDDTNLQRFCSYMEAEQPQFNTWKVAVISEDETAYGSSGIARQGDGAKKTDCPGQALRLFYPRDISALRGAYQTKSIFDAAIPSQATDAQRRNLPTDLADPAGRVHDSVRSYGGNQTPLSQEAFMLNMVAALREFHARYILLRSSNILDQLFLTDFLRRSYPNGRIVIFGSDLLFVRERGATGLGGTMFLSNYPLFPLARDWTEYKSLPAADRMFSSDTSEGTYIALRLLLNEKSLNQAPPDTRQCHVLDKAPEHKPRIFLPPVACATDPPIPDYSPPRWAVSNHCGDHQKGEDCPYSGPATWISVIGMNRLWPVASLTGQTQRTASTNPPSPDSQKQENPAGIAEEPGQIRRCRRA